MFGHVEYDTSEPEVEAVFKCLFDPMFNHREALSKFITYVHARSIIDLVRSNALEFHTKWVVGNLPNAFTSLHLLDDMCLLGEDLDLHFIGSVTCDYRLTVFYKIFHARIVDLCSRMCVNILLSI